MPQIKSLSIFKDARHFQIIYLGVFLSFGLLTLGWAGEWTHYLSIFFTALSVQGVFVILGKAHKSSWKSAVITALGLSLLFKSGEWSTMAIAAFIGIASKFLIRYDGKHLFNPANIGIVAAILLTGDGWVSPGQWGSSALFIFLFGALGCIVLFKVGRLDTTITFLIAFFILEYCRTVLFLGWGMDVLIHKLTNGSFLLFAFFMITDPKTTPDHPRGRIVWAIGVALLAFILSHWMFIHTAPIWALVVITPLTVLLDKKFKWSRFQWQVSTPRYSQINNHKSMNTMKKTIAILLIGLMVSADASAFCGFYVAKADATLFNSKSQVILVRDGERTTVTMSNDFKGDVRDFAMVVPVPEVLQRHSIRVVDPSLFTKLDDYSAPRMVEYYDDNPCQQVYLEDNVGFTRALSNISVTSMDMGESVEEKGYSVTIEAKYEVEEYDVLILSAKESNGLKRWLTDNDYKIPASAEEVLDPYIKNGLKFFVVKVDMDRKEQSGTNYLRPLQITYSSDRFMLPIRLGMANAQGPQDMIVYGFTKRGRIECTNYRTVDLPTDRNIPKFVKDKGEFGPFYKDLFANSYKREGENAVFLEYAWEVTPNAGIKCDPCVGPPPMYKEFADAGVNWLSMNQQASREPIFFTRLHVRYTRDEFPQDLQFQVTPNKQRFQGRYVITHPAKGDLSCADGQRYLKDLEWRRKKEVDELAALTGWEKPRYQAYIYEYSDRIQEEDRNVVPVVSLPTGGGPNLILLLGLLLGCVSVGVFLSSYRNKLPKRSLG